MADRKNFSRYNMRCGVLIHAPQGGVRIIRINAPEMDSRFLFLTGNDMPGDDSFSIFSSSFPILAKEKVAYHGQVAAALFAPDYESALLMASDIGIETEEAEADADDSSVPYPLEYGWGDFNPEEEEEGRYRKVESSFSLAHTARRGRRLYTVTAWIEGATLHIEAPSEWPELVRDTVEHVTGYPKRNIVLHLVPYTARNDEFLLEPAALAAITATATIRSGLPCELRTETLYSHPGISVKRETWIDEEGKPASEKAVMTVDQGAFTILPEEYQRQACAGLIPPYPLKSFKSVIKITTSLNAPAAFSLSLGYSEALASTEYHISRLAEKTELTPHLYRAAVEKEKRRFTDYLPGFDMDDQKKTAETVAKRSSYDRKWAANSFHKRDFGIMGYLRGIGFASGTGIAGFSTTFRKSSGFGAVMTYTQKHNVIVNTSYINHPGTVRRWKKVIADRLTDGMPDKVAFSDHGNDSMDIGPDVLSRIVTSFSSQLESAAKKLAVLKDEEPLPVSLKFDAEDSYYPCEFENAGCGTVVCEVSIRQSDMKPVATAIWAAFSFHSILDEESLRNALKRTLMMTLSEFGAEIPMDFQMNIEISSTGSGGALSSPQELARGLAIGALSDALMQAAGKEAAALPTSSSMIEELFRK